MMINPEEVSTETGTNYPDEFKSMVAGRFRQRLGNQAGLKNFGVNLVKLEPNGASALRHWHSHQDEFIYVLSGELTLITDAGKEVLTPGMAAGFRAGKANGHHLVNDSGEVAVYLEVGDRTLDDEVTYPDNDLATVWSADGTRIFTHLDGTPY